MRTRLSALKEEVEELVKAAGDELASNADKYAEVGAIKAAIAAYEAALPVCVETWKKQWQQAVASTKGSGMLDRVVAGLAEAKRWAKHAYGPGARVGGRHYDHERAYQAVANLARATIAEVEKAKAKAAGNAGMVATLDKWVAQLEGIIEEAERLHVELNMEWGVKSRDQRYVNALKGNKEAQDKLKAAIAQAIAEQKVSTYTHWLGSHTGPVLSPQSPPSPPRRARRRSAQPQRPRRSASAWRAWPRQTSWRLARATRRLAAAW